VYLRACRTAFHRAAEDNFYRMKEYSYAKSPHHSGALAVGFALISATALAQNNIQGPAAPNFGVNSNSQTGGMLNTGPNAASPQPHYNNAPSNHGGQAQARSRHARGSDRR
jgi:hypothetical protein